MAPDDEPEAGDPGDREHHGLVAEDRLAREGRDDVGRKAHRGQDHDVDGRVRVEPEEVLPHQGLAAADDRGRVPHAPVERSEEVRPGSPVEKLHGERGRQDREGEGLQAP